MIPTRPTAASVLQIPVRLLTALAFLLAAASVASFAEAPHEVTGLEQEVWNLVNQERARAGVGRLDWDADLARAARIHSDRMAEAGFFSHVDPERGDMRQRVLATGGKRLWSALAENLAEREDRHRVAEGAVADWMESPGHKANLLNSRYQRTGVGVSFSADGRCYITQIFGRSR